MDSKALQQYLVRHSELTPELEALADLGSHDEAVVVPCRGENALIDGLIQSLSQAAAHSGVQVLVLLVINEDCETPTAHRAMNRLLLERFRFLSGAHLTLFALDRTGAEAPPPRQGVGLARKMGCDAVLQLQARRLLRSDYLHTTDADARVAEDYFDLRPSVTRPWGLGPLPVGVFVHPFQHSRLGEEGEALGLYDQYLRYYCRGLSYAGSPFAFPTIGSTFSFSKEAYARVRGFPRREAGEDFYFLHKVAKTAFVWPGGGTVKLVARSSDRVPFGTGRSAKRITELLRRGEPYRVYAPQIFLELQTWLRAIDQLSAGCPWKEAEGRFDPPLRQALEAMGAEVQWRKIEKQREDFDGRFRDWHTWFDGFRTLRLIHRLRDSAYPSVPIASALDSSASLFCGPDHRSESFLGVLGVEPL